MDQTSTIRRRGLLAGVFIVLLLLIDQWLKYVVKTNMMLGESIRVTDWFYIYFIENPGMAFGWEVFNKAFLSVFRIIASGFILWMIAKISKGDYGVGFLLCISAIFAGAIGNIIDSIFYGVIFDHSMGQVATLFPESGGYAGWLHGKVVDMFYFPLIEGRFPEWLPIWGGDEFIFFRPVFNFADACISVGVFVLILFYTKSFGRLLNSIEKKPSSDPQDA